MKTFFKFSLGLLFGYLIGAIIIFLFQRNMIYRPPPNAPSPERAGLDNVEIISLPNTSDEEKAFRFWYLPGDPEKSTIIYFHGNGSNVAYKAHIFRDLNNAGYSVIGAEYPGYYHNPGRPSQDSIMEKALAQYDWAIGQGANPDKIVLFGNSLGTGVVSQLAAQHTAELIILDAPFDTMSRRAKMNFPIYPANLLLRDKWDSVEALSQQNSRIVWLHGTHDSVVPLDLGRSLFESYHGSKTAHIIPRGEHTNLWTLGGREIVLQELENLNE